jgi:sulfur dioxygenase
MYFRILHDDASGEQSYLLADLDAREAVLVDPRGADLPVLLALLAERELHLRWVLRTHHHDHLHPQEPSWLAQLGAPLIQGEVDGAEHQGADGKVLPFGGELLRVLATGATLAALPGRAACPAAGGCWRWMPAPISPVGGRCRPAGTA